VGVTIAGGLGICQREQNSMTVSWGQYLRTDSLQKYREQLRNMREG
jgi:hypothetical protein